jgi:hypothetical protein
MNEAEELLFAFRTLLQWSGWSAVCARVEELRHKQ